jgi:sialic acid synthase SpsE
MSTGLANEAEIAAAVAVLRRGWQGREPGLALLHCVSAYPAPPEQMNLATIAHLGRTFAAVPGLSDHSLGGVVATAAVALGARVVEKHVTLRRADGGPDSHFSLEPDEFARMVADVRTVERAIGRVACGPQPADRGNLVFRRSLFVVRDVAAGALFTADNVRSIRPGHGLAPEHLPAVLGRRAAQACAPGTPLRWDLLA